MLFVGVESPANDTTHLLIVHASDSLYAIARRGPGRRRLLITSVTLILSLWSPCLLGI